MPTFGPVDVTTNDSVFTASSTGTLNATTSMLLAGRRSDAPRNAGLRWDNVTVSPAASITSATLEIDVSAESGSPTITVYGDDVVDAPAWSQTTERPTDITQTTASVDYDANYSGTGLKAIGVTAIVQELADQATATSQAMRFALQHDGGGSGYNYIAFDNESPYWGANVEPRLTIVWTAGGGGGGGARQILFGMVGA